MGREKGTPEQRKEALMVYVEDVMRGDFLGYIAARFGKDALMSAVLEATELGKRTRAEKLAEIAFDLVPGQVQRVCEARTRSVIFPRIPDDDPLWNTKMEVAPRFEQFILEPLEWRWRARFAFDEESGILAVNEV